MLPNLEWIGFQLNDMETFGLLEQESFRACMFLLSAQDKKIARTLITKLQILNEFALVDQVKLKLK
jgi:hypothetical protein